MGLDIVKKLKSLLPKAEQPTAQATRAAFNPGLDATALLEWLDPVLKKAGKTAKELHELLGDAHVMSVTQTRKMGTLRREWELRPGGEDPASQKLAEMLEADLGAMNFYDVASQILDAPLFGMIPIELLWEAREGMIRLKEIRPLPPQWFGFNSENQLVLKKEDGSKVDLQPGKFVMARHSPSYDNPHGQALLSRCFWPVAFKKGGIKFWVQLAEKFGMPFLIGKYPAGATEKEQQQMLTALSQAYRDFVMATPEGASVELMGVGGKGGAEIHSGLKDAMNDEISKVILGQNLTTEVRGGSYAAAKTHADVLSAYQEADQKMLAQVMLEIARWYQLINDANAKPPEFHWFEETDVRKERAERDDILTKTGVKFTKTYFKAQYGLDDEDFDLVEPQNGKINSTPQETPNFNGYQEGERREFSQSELQDEIDLFAQSLADQDASQKGLAQQIAQALEQAQSAEDFAKRMAGLLGKELDSNQMFEALLLADLAGRAGLKEQTHA